jgi:NTP pyrophosphatase (non-canonical NTP hydrolase)
MKELINNVEQWAADKGILEHATTLRQAEKTLEECQELICAILNEDRDEIKLELGDVLVTLIIQAKMQNITIEECLEAAYNKIANRKGQLINGQFVRDDKYQNGI